MTEQTGNLEYFKIPIKSLILGRPKPFPLYIHLALNDRMLLCYREDQAISSEDLYTHDVNGLVDFWCPKEFLPKWKDYLENPESNVINFQRIEGFCQTELRSEARKIIGVLSNQTSLDLDENKKNLQRCKEFNEKIIRHSLQRRKLSSIYNEMLILNKEDGDHSFLVSAFSVIFGLAIGDAMGTVIGMEQLGDLALGGLVHDIGLIKLNSSLLKKDQKSYTDEEREELTEHLQRGLEILERAQAPVSPTVLAIVEQHHENYDGSGYPNRKTGNEISLFAQIVAFADQIVDVMTGQMDGQARAPRDALAYMIEIQGKNRAVCRFDPRLFNQIVSFIEAARIAHADATAARDEHARGLSA